MRRRNIPPRGTKGVTLLEILVVLGIIGLLAAVVAPRVLGYLSRATVQAAELQLDALRSATRLYYIDTGRFPTEQESLEVLISPSPGTAGWAGPYLDSRDGLIDPWGREYIYRAPNDETDFDIITLGRDGALGGEGEDRDLSLR